MAQPENSRADLSGSPQILERVMDCLRERFVVIDRNYRVLVVNEAALPNSVRKHDILYKTLFDVYPNLQQQGFKPLIDKVFATGEPYNDIYVRHTTVDGFTGYHNRKLIPFKDATGNVEGVILVVENVHEERVAQLQNKQTEYEYTQLIETLQLVSFELNASGTIVRINKAVGPVLGYEPGELLGKSFTRNIHPDDVRGTWHVYWQIVNLRKPFGVCENRFKAADGTHITMRWSIHPLYDSNGAVVGCRGVGENITAVAERMSEMQEQTKMYDQTIEVAPLPLLVVQNGCIRKINRAAQRLLRVNVRGSGVKLQELCEKQSVHELFQLHETARVSGSAHGKIEVQGDGKQISITVTIVRISNAFVIALQPQSAVQ